MASYKVYVKKSGFTATMDKLWNVVQIEAENEEKLQKELKELSKKGWKIFKVSKIE